MTVGPNTSSYNVDSFIVAQSGRSFGAKNIVSAKVKSITLSLSNATPESNFQNFKSCTLLFHSNSYSGDYLVTIADNPDIYANMLTFPIDPGADFRRYLGNVFTYTMMGSLRRPVKTPLSCTITYSIDLTVVE